MSRIAGLDDLDEMFPTEPQPTKEEGKTTKSKAGVKNKKETAPKKTVAVKEKTSVQDKDKNEPLNEEPQKTEHPQENNVKPTSIEDDENKPDNIEEDKPENFAEDTFSVVEKKERFIDKYKQENVWLENELKAQLDEIFEGKPKGFKTKFYNAALKFAVSRYKGSNK